jgi:hemerythrin superfamily protein
MNATELLKKQHDEVKQLFEEFERAEDEEGKRLAFEHLADDLAAHATIEEKLFYPAVYVGDLKDQLQEAAEEHLSVKRVIADLLEMNVEEEEFEAKMSVLKEQVEDHVEDEEGELFPKVRRKFASQELEALGGEMEAMFNDLKEQEPREQIPNQIEEAAPLE